MANKGSWDKDLWNNKELWTVICILYVILIILGAVIPDPQDIPGFGGYTKFWHFVGFIFLALLSLKTLCTYKFKHPFIITFFIGVFLAYITEILQLLVPTRHFLYGDMIIDMSGFIIGMIIYRWTFYKE